ncbi:undecaprenyl-phosphate glucose phosphotransferase [Pedobacter sp. HMF7647]|uniref:Undecaprenyl-phosphate glucose phosphotransferase n=1 Tax=Hufsiella arboris TaxID=2695275 RepID=A0A7K1YAW1_9SPHI|nr:undecaprenyl-phosphate glucose phosphotransferase [Hufsiella arboris]MXV51723.1 undecaprenyl-phosphate glucose phosphotransferase [Hufsiella arboris]
MNRPFYIYSVLRYLIDAPVLVITFFLAQSIFPLWEENAGHSYIFIFVFFSIISWFTSAQFTRIYSDLRSKKFSEEIIYVASTVFLHTILLTSFLFFFRYKFLLSNVFLAFYISLLFFLVSVFKYLVRKFSHFIIYRGKLLKNILLVGSTPAAYDFYETINRFNYYGYRCIGFIDDKQTQLNGCSYLGKTDDLENILRENTIDEVVIALPNSEHQQITQAVEVCDYHAKSIRIIPDLQFYTTSNIQVNNIGLLPVISIRSLPQDKLGNQLVKRFFDILFSLMFFAVFGWWLLPLISLAIKLTSNGPVFFKQERWGLNNEKIICYKFRTMMTGSPEKDHNGNYLQATKDDPRVTPFGRILRQTNMDELPQFWNVLAGNMSVVGPRPHPTPLNLESIRNVDKYLQRHLVKPGITGMAQVNGCRGETKTPAEMQKRVDYDLYYIHRWTFWLDCQIILQTVINFFRGDQNAY